MSYQYANLDGSQTVPEWEERFKDGVFALFRRWVTVQLIVSQEWSGNRSRDLVTQLVNELLELLLTRKRRALTLVLSAAPNGAAHGGPEDVDKLAEFLRVRMYELCNVELEDDSDLEISRKCIGMLDQCRVKNYELVAREQQLQAEENGTHALTSCRFHDASIEGDEAAMDELADESEEEPAGSAAPPTTELSSSSRSSLACGQALGGQETFHASPFGGLLNVGAPNLFSQVASGAEGMAGASGMGGDGNRDVEMMDDEDGFEMVQRKRR